jgi:hypothetical protein
MYYLFQENHSKFLLTKNFNRVLLLHKAGEVKSITSISRWIFIFVVSQEKFFGYKFHNFSYKAKFNRGVYRWECVLVWICIVEK